MHSCNDWELPLVVNLLSLLNKEKIDMLVEDRMWWSLRKDGRFTVKLPYGTLAGNATRTIPFMWNICAPSRAVFFDWEVAWEKSLGLDNVQKRGILVAN